MKWEHLNKRSRKFLSATAKSRTRILNMLLVMRVIGTDGKVRLNPFQDVKGDPNEEKGPYNPSCVDAAVVRKRSPAAF